LLPAAADERAARGTIADSNAARLERDLSDFAVGDRPDGITVRFSLFGRCRKSLQAAVKDRPEIGHPFGKMRLVEVETGSGG
jgi:hypothetical protein